MSGTISNFGFPQLGQLAAGLSLIQKNFDTLSQQASTGLISNTYAGLGTSAPVALALNTQLNHLQTAQTNIASAGGPAQIAQTAMVQIGSIASNLLAEMPNLAGLSASGIDLAAANARTDLAQVGDLLDSQYGSVYVFAGQDSSNPPVPNPDQITSSGFYTQISAAVGSLSTNGAAATVASTLATASSNAAGTSPFSTYLSQPPTAALLPSVSTGDGHSQTIGLLASGNASAISTGTSTTGSYMRDLMRALATVGSMSGTQGTDPNFASLVNDTKSSVTDAITAMDTDVGVLGEQQSNLSTLSTNLDDTQNALATQLSSAQEVDMALTLSNLSLVQTQMQESYQLIAAASGLSLVKFLPV